MVDVRRATLIIIFCAQKNYGKEKEGKEGKERIIPLCTYSAKPLPTNREGFCFGRALI